MYDAQALPHVLSKKHLCDIDFIFVEQFLEFLEESNVR